MNLYGMYNEDIMMLKKNTKLLRFPLVKIGHVQQKTWWYLTIITLHFLLVQLIRL